MLISYPIIPAGTDALDEDAKLAAALTHELLDEGTFPVGIDGRWHGGIHMSAGGEPIRAIADGEVVCFRCKDATLDYPGQGNSDVDFILLKHTTETGENTPVVFYSLYMHLAHRPSLAPDRLGQLPKFWRDATASPAPQKPGSSVKIYRKDVLGFAGLVYDRTDVFHFEVFATDIDLAHFWKDSTAVTTHGSDDVYGDMHFIIPASHTFTARHPSAPATGNHRLNFDTSHHLDLPLGTAGTNAVRLFVTVQLKLGRYVATSKVERDGAFVTLGQDVVIDDYEYELYRQSVLLYPDCPSAGFEWLRFGRVLGPDITTTAQNIKPIRYSDTALGYVDLAQAGVIHLSDADFPHWHGWEKVEEGQALSPADGLCDVQALLDILNAADADKDGKTTKEELAAYLRQDQNSAVRTKLRHMVVKQPTEWDDDEATIEARYGRLKAEGQPLHEPESWTAFVEHVKQMAFWSKSGIADKSVWHFHPLQFARKMKSSSWLSKDELVLLIPKKVIRKPGSQNATTNGVWESPSIANAKSFLAIHYIEINKSLRKYLIESGSRKSCYIGNCTQETAWFHHLKEANGQQPNLHQGWYGRGLLQLTNPNGSINQGNNNYYKYFRFCGKNPAVMPSSQEISWRDEVGINSFHATNSAGVYWVWSSKSEPTPQNPNRPQVDNTNKFADEAASIERRTINTDDGVKTWYYSQSFANCAAAVNYPGAVGNNPPNMNGLVDRSTSFINALMVLLDSPVFPSIQNVPLKEPENWSRQTS